MSKNKSNKIPILYAVRTIPCLTCLTPGLPDCDNSF